MAWYQKTLEKSPTYQALLSRLHSTQTERRWLLARFFDANDSERERGTKQPSAVHGAIADLVKFGHLRSWSLRLCAVSLRLGSGRGLRLFFRRSDAREAGALLVLGDGLVAVAWPPRGTPH